MSKVTFPAVLACLWLETAPPAARAQSAPVATAETGIQIDTWLADAGNPSDAGPVAVPSAASSPDGAIHGEVEVGVGSGGSRLARLSAVIPVGTNGELGVALADEGIVDRRGRTDRTSFALSLRIGEAGSSEPCGLRHTGVRLASDLHQDSLCARPGALNAEAP